MPELYGPDGKRLKIASGEEATAAFASGQAGFAPGQRVHVVSPDGQIGTIDAQEAQDALSGGYKIAGDVDVEKARFQEEHGEGLETVKAGAEGLARGLTFGLSDAALTETGIGDAEAMQARQEANPLAAGGAELVGAIAPMLLSGGVSGAATATGLAARAGQGARALGAIPRGTAALGRGAETVAKGLLGSRSGTLLGRAASTAAGGVTEGAVIGAGHAVSAAALDDVELTAEQLMAGARDGALFGGGAGAVLGGVTAGAGMAARKAADLTPEKVRKLFSPQAVDDFIKERSFAAAKGPGGGKKWVEKARKRAGGEERVGQVLLDEGVVTRESTLEVINQRATAKVAEKGEQIGQVMRQLDETVELAKRPTNAGIAKRIRDDVLAPMRKSGGIDEERIAGRIEREMEARGLMPGELRPVKQMSFSELHDTRRMLDAQKGKFDMTTKSAETAAYRDIRRIVEDEFETSIQKATKGLPDDALSTYKDLKQRYSALTLARDMSDDALNAQGANRKLSITDMMTALGGAGAASGALDGLVTGGLGTLAVALASGYASRVVRQNGAAFVAGGLHELRAVNAVTRRAVQVERKMDSAVRGFFERAKTAPRRAVAIGESRRKRYERAVEELAESPATTVDRVVERMGPSRDDALTAAYTTTAIRGREFLASKAPKPKRPASLLRPDLDKTQRVSDAEMAKYLRYVDAVKDPLGVIEAVERGDVTREGVEALAAVYPKMHERLVTRVMDMVTEAKEPLPYGKLVQLSLVLQRPLHPSLEGRFIAAAQRRYAAPAAEQKQQASGGGSGLLAPSRRSAPETSQRHLTESQALETPE